MKTLIDYLSFSWCPAELGQIIQLAKMGASIKAIRGFEFDQYGNNKPTQILDTGKMNVAAGIRKLMSDTDFAVNVDSRSFHEVKRDLLDHFGLNTVDTLCCGEIDRFITRLNNGLTTAGNEWSHSLRSGGFSGYPHSANILVNGQQAGLCAWGAKNHGCYVSFSGSGCVALDMQQMYDAIKELPGAKLTRVDIAYDDYEGKNNVDTARQLAEDGQFITRGRPCSYCYIESGHMAKLCDYVKESGKTESLKKRYGLVPDLGRSFYVGSRDAGKMLRVYEKGKQLKSDKYPDWVRWELELRSKDRVIPFDTLISADKYIAGAYPALAHICEKEQCVIATHKRSYMTSIDNAVKNGSTQCGKLVNYMKNVLTLSPEQIVKKLTDHLEYHEIPDRLNSPVFGESLESEKISMSDMLVLRRNQHENQIYNRLTLA